MELFFINCTLVGDFAPVLYLYPVLWHYWLDSRRVI